MSLGPFRGLVDGLRFVMDVLVSTCPFGPSTDPVAFSGFDG